MKPIKKILGCLLFCSALSCIQKTVNGQNSINVPPTVTNDLHFYLTTGDRSVLLKKQTAVLSFGTINNSNLFIDVDSSMSFQKVSGFGFTLTGGSAFVINQMTSSAKARLLNELFGKDSTSIGISYIRLSMGASDLNASVFSYDDLPSGQTDTTLAQFSLAPDMVDLIPILRQILAINPTIKIIAAPWSAPVWMKDNGSSVGGGLNPAYYNAYARYFVKYIQKMKALGISIDAITPQNEPLNPGNNPSLVMPASEQASFIKNYLGPAFRQAGITTAIVVYDHNCDRPDYPETILSDPAANAYVNGSAFHLYAGDISALSQVHNAYPDKQIYFTEQYTSSTGNFSGDLKWHVKNVIIGSMRNWSQNALEWNLANDVSYGPHTTGGCTTCKGALTITGSSVDRNVGYYIVAHASKFVPGGSMRIASNIAGNLQNVAFLTPSGKKVLIVENDDPASVTFNIRFKGKWVTSKLDAGAVGTYIW